MASSSGGRPTPPLLDVVKVLRFRREIHRRTSDMYRNVGFTQGNTFMQMDAHGMMMYDGKTYGSNGLNHPFLESLCGWLIVGRERERVRVTVTIKQGRSTTFFLGGYNWNQLTHGHIDFVLQHKQSAVYCVLFLNVITSSCCIIPPTSTFNYIVTIPLHPQSWGLLPITNKPIKNTPSTLVWLMALTILSVSPQQLRQRCPWCHPECWL